MRLIRLTEEYIGEIIAGRLGLRGPLLESCALAVGSFDGLHRGHLTLIDGVKEARDRLDLAEGVLFTFMQHPRQILDPVSDAYLLTTWREKLSILQQTGIGVIVAADFCPALAKLSYQDFVSRFLVDYLGMKHLVAGYDVHLGANREGTADTLEKLGEDLGYSLEVCSPVVAGNWTISSSAIRQAIREGNLPLATDMLGRPYILWGEVTPGDRRGREIGYPTANLMPLDNRKLLPAGGVYAVKVQIPGDVVAADSAGVLARVTESLPEVDMQGEILSAAPGDWAVFGGMLNFGHVPTFHGDGLPEPRIEANIFGFDGDLRGRNLKIEWIERLRPERKFAGRDELVTQLEQDEAQARSILGMPD